jgi:hypothetical protein
MKYLSDIQKMLYRLKPWKTSTKRYWAGMSFVYEEQVLSEQPTEQQPLEAEIYEGRLPEPLDYEPPSFDFLPEVHTPDLRIEPPQPLQIESPQPPEGNPTLEVRTEDPQQEIQQAIDEIKEPDGLEDLLRQSLFPPIF